MGDYEIREYEPEELDTDRGWNLVWVFLGLFIVCEILLVFWSLWFTIPAVIFAVLMCRAFAKAPTS